MIDRRRFALCAALAAGLALASSRALAADDFDTSSPTATIATLQRGLLGAARAGATVDDRYRALEPLILATHDLPYIAEFALRRQWGSLGEHERARFVAAFERLSVMTYAARFGSVGSETFRAIAPAASPDSSGRVQVTTAVARAGGLDVALEYLLAPGEQGWRIINIVADGVSDLALKRAEYQRLFASGGLEGLLAELEAQTKRLRGE